MLVKEAAKPKQKTYKTLTKFILTVVKHYSLLINKRFKTNFKLIEKTKI